MCAAKKKGGGNETRGGGNYFVGVGESGAKNTLREKEGNGGWRRRLSLSPARGCQERFYC